MIEVPYFSFTLLTKFCFSSSVIDSILIFTESPNVSTYLTTNFLLPNTSLHIWLNSFRFISFPTNIIALFKGYRKKEFYNNEKRVVFEILNEK